MRVRTAAGGGGFSRTSCFVLQVFKNFHVQFEMKKKQAEPLLQPSQPDGKLSVDQALVKQAWDHVCARVPDPFIGSW